MASNAVSACPPRKSAFEGEVLLVRLHVLRAPCLLLVVEAAARGQA
jgi:hypothetical protein